MKITKKLILSFGSLSIFAIPLATAISCGDNVTTPETKQILDKLTSLDMKPVTIAKMQKVKTGNNHTVWEDLTEEKAIELGITSSLPELKTYDDKEIKMQFSFSRTHWEINKPAKFDLKFQVYYIWKEQNDGVKDKELVTSEPKVITSADNLTEALFNDSIALEDNNSVVNWALNSTSMKMSNLSIASVQTGSKTVFSPLTTNVSSALGYINNPSVHSKTTVEYSLSQGEGFATGKKGNWIIIFKTTHLDEVRVSEEVKIESFDFVSQEIIDTNRVFADIAVVNNFVISKTNLATYEKLTQYKSTSFAPLTDTISSALFNDTLPTIASNSSVSYSLEESTTNVADTKGNFIFNFKVNNTTTLTNVISPSAIILTSTNTVPHTLKSALELEIKKIPVAGTSDLTIAQLEDLKTLNGDLTTDVASKFGISGLRDFTREGFTHKYSLTGDATDGTRGTYMFKLWLTDGTHSVDSQPFKYVSSDTQPHSLASIMDLFKMKTPAPRTYEELNALVTPIEGSAVWVVMNQTISNKLGYIGTLPNENDKVSGFPIYKWEYQLRPQPTVNGEKAEFWAHFRVSKVSEPNTFVEYMNNTLFSSDNTLNDVELEKQRIEKLIADAENNEFEIEGTISGTVASDLATADANTLLGFIPTSIKENKQDGVTHTYSYSSSNDNTGKVVLKITVSKDGVRSEEIEITVFGFHTSLERIQAYKELVINYFPDPTNADTEPRPSVYSIDKTSTQLSNQIGKYFSSFDKAVQGLGIQGKPGTVQNPNEWPTPPKGVVIAIGIKKRETGDKFIVEIQIRHGSAFIEPIEVILLPYSPNN